MNSEFPYLGGLKEPGSVAVLGPFPGPHTAAYHGHGASTPDEASGVLLD